MRCRDLIVGIEITVIIRMTVIFSPSAAAGDSRRLTLKFHSSVSPTANRRRFSNALEFSNGFPFSDHAPSSKVLWKIPEEVDEDAETRSCREVRRAAAAREIIASGSFSSASSLLA